MRPKKCETTLPFFYAYFIFFDKAACFCEELRG
jgi:hypothetical protein